MEHKRYGDSMCNLLLDASSFFLFYVFCCITLIRLLFLFLFYFVYFVTFPYFVFCTCFDSYLHTMFCYHF